MISYQSPGVYIEEVAAGPQPITAAPTSVVAIVGATQRGPVQEPTRITGWSEFQAVFGARPVPGGYTAQAVYGFFENGGPAAYVVRADDSVRATWEVLRADNATAGFGVEATSPGSWANELGVAVTLDTTAGSGVLYAGRVKLAADDSLAAGQHQKTLTVSSVVGVAAGDPVLVVTSTGTPRAATVESVDATGSRLTLGVPAGTELVLPAKATWVVAAVPSTGTALRLATGSGFQRGDVVTAVTPSMGRASAVVEGLAAAAPGLMLTLAAKVNQVLPGGEFAVRVVRLTADLPAPTSPDAKVVPLSALSWKDAPTPEAADLQTGHQAVTAGGLTGVWEKARTRLEFPADVPAGPVEVDVQLAARRFRETVTLDHPSRASLAERYSFVPDGTVVKLSGAGGDTLSLTRDSAKDDGWAAAASDPADTVWTQVDIAKPADATKGIVVRCVRPPEPGSDFVELEPDKRYAVARADHKGGDVYVVSVEGTAPVAVGDTGRYPLFAFQTTTLNPLRFALRVTERGAEVESYTQLAMHPDHPRHYRRDGIVNGVSPRITVGPPAGGALAPDTLPRFVRPKVSGSDRPVTTAGLKTGFDQLERVTEPAMVICPDLLTFADPLLQADVVGAMTRHCEEFRRIAIVDAPAYGDDRQLAEWRGTVVNSVQAATYAPHVRMVNLETDAAERIVTVPPSGFVAGVFARTDRERGVHKAPANERVKGIVGTAEDYTQRRQDLLNPAGVNLIRAFPGRGTRVWGARTSSDDTLWRYVSVRRLFNLIETSVERSTNWVVFEPNTQDTWLRIRVSVENFLDQLFRGGALAGTSPEQAYRVRVGLGETMTETDVDLGLVVTEVAVAPAKPAEFVIFRFSHKRLTE
ncbi:phage tail sheath subtilisin-like domain-containing protein [Streptomyces sp. NPDC058739]|uniref:phage tail sheath subtilisin-like domain-containing protein n=1 Tax=Streptomyces sp. NPDC058739 TaxID=3346618 RepID=UPI003696DE25